jgi:hypothetical protein
VTLLLIVKIGTTVWRVVVSATNNIIRDGGGVRGHQGVDCPQENSLNILLNPVAYILNWTPNVG